MIPKQKPKHWPTLNTVIMVEDVLKNMKGSVMKVSELKKELPRQINHNTLILILYYLEESNKITTGLRGITWIHNSNSNIRKAIEKGMQI